MGLGKRCIMCKEDVLIVNIQLEHMTGEEMDDV